MNNIKYIKITGILSKYFGELIKVNLSNVKYLLNALDCVKPGFRKKINELIQNGQNYSIVQNHNCIHLVPLIGGSGRVGMIIAGIALIAIGIVIAIVTYGSGSPISAFFFQVGVSLFVSGSLILLQTFDNAMHLKGVPTNGDPSKDVKKALGGFVMGGEERVWKDNKSNVFDSTTNRKAQGIDIPIGYGKMKLPSMIISISVKNFSQSSAFLTQSMVDYYTPPFFDYVAN
jgi:predicted phage tail protein